MRVAGGGWHLDTHRSAREFSRVCRKVRSWGSGAWRVRDAEERHVHVPCPAETARGSIATPATFGAGALDFELAAPEGTRRSWPCGAAPRAHLGAAPPAWPEGRVRGVRRAWLCRPGGDPARAGCASFQGFLALPSVRACWRTRRRGARSRARAPLSVPRLRPLRPRQGQASPRRASGECRVPWPGSGDLRRPGLAADRERLLVLAGRSSSG